MAEFGHGRHVRICSPLTLTLCTKSQFCWRIASNYNLYVANKNPTSQTQGIHSPVPPTLDELAIRGLPLRAIAALDVIARCDGHIYHAAKIQGISPAALSTQIARLEEALGSDVLKRKTSDRRTMELTEKGHLLVGALRTALPALVNLSASFRKVRMSPDSKRKRRSRTGQLPRRSA